MGSYSVLYIGNIKLRSVEDDFDPSVLILFDKNNKRVRAYSPQVEQDQQFEDWDEPPQQRVDYAVSLAIVKDRLEFMGLTMTHV